MRKTEEQEFKEVYKKFSVEFLTRFFFVLITENFLHKEIHGKKFQASLFLFFRSKLNLSRLDVLFPSFSKQHRPLSLDSFQTDWQNSISFW